MRITSTKTGKIKIKSPVDVLPQILSNLHSGKQLLKLSFFLPLSLPAFLPSYSCSPSSSPGPLSRPYLPYQDAYLPQSIATTLHIIGTSNCEKVRHNSPGAIRLFADVIQCRSVGHSRTLKWRLPCCAKYYATFKNLHFLRHTWDPYSYAKVVPLTD